MKVLYETKVRDSSPNYHFLRVEKWCCATMEDTATKDDERERPFELSACNRLFVPKMHLRHGYEGQYDNYVTTDEYPIDFCPFCGERIECIEVNRVVQAWKPAEQVVRTGEWVDVKEGPGT